MYTFLVQVSIIVCLMLSITTELTTILCSYVYVATIKLHTYISKKNVCPKMHAIIQLMTIQSSFKQTAAPGNTFHIPEIRLIFRHNSNLNLRGFEICWEDSHEAGDGQLDGLIMIVISLLSVPEGKQHCKMVCYDEAYFSCIWVNQYVY